MLCAWCHSEIREGHACVTVRPRADEHAEALAEIEAANEAAVMLAAEIECYGRERLADVMAGADLPGSDGEVCRMALRIRAAVRESNRVIGRAN